MPQSNVLPMKPQFARWVVDGRKTSTLRSKVYPAGRYLMKIGGKPFAEVAVASDGKPIIWTDLTATQKEVLAGWEGFDSIAAFEDALSKLQIHGNYWLRPFLAGTKPLYLHILSNPKEVTR